MFVFILVSDLSALCVWSHEPTRSEVRDAWVSYWTKRWQRGDAGCPDEEETPISPQLGIKPGWLLGNIYSPDAVVVPVEKEKEKTESEILLEKISTALVAGDALGVPRARLRTYVRALLLRGEGQ